MTAENNILDICDNEHDNKDELYVLRKKMPPENDIYDIAELFKVFGDSTRARIISALSIGELCVCDIAELLSMTSSAISHQLRILRQARIIRSRRAGKTVYYKLDDEHISSIFLMASAHILEERRVALCSENN